MDWNPILYDQSHKFVSDYGADLITWLRPQPGEYILDLGCGTGHLTSQIAQAGARVLGMDRSAAMVARARQTYPHLEFTVADATDFHFPEPFDAIFSNAALHWVTAAEAAVVCMAAALKPGGRLVVELGGYGNIARVSMAIQTAFAQVVGQQVQERRYFPRLSEYATLLEDRGFSVRRAQFFPRPTPLEDGELGLRRWLEQFEEEILRNLYPPDREAVIQHLEATLRPDLFREGSWVIDYWRLRIEALR